MGFIVAMTEQNKILLALFYLFLLLSQVTAPVVDIHRTPHTQEHANSDNEYIRVAATIGGELIPNDCQCATDGFLYCFEANTPLPSSTGNDVTNAHATSSNSYKPGDKVFCERIDGSGTKTNPIFEMASPTPTTTTTGKTGGSQTTSPSNVPTSSPGATYHRTSTATATAKPTATATSPIASHVDVIGHKAHAHDAKLLEETLFTAVLVVVVVYIYKYTKKHKGGLKFRCHHQPAQYYALLPVTNPDDVIDVQPAPAHIP